MAPTKQPSKRKNVTTACLFCRESKVKCDGARPNCSNCEIKGKSCYYQLGIDKRKLSLRLAVDLLVKRVGQLYQFINDQGFRPPPMSEEDDSALRELLRTRGLENMQSALHEAENNQKDIQESRIHHDPSPDREGELSFVDDFNPELVDPSLFILSLPEVIKDTSPDPHNTQSASSQPTTSGDNTISNSEGVEELVTQLSDRMGSLQIGSDGHVRYYGPTSHFNLLRMPTPDNLTIHRTIRQDGPDILDRLGVGKDIPTGFEEHLINLYFTWHNPLSQVVDREMYESARQKWHTKMEDTPYYSESLTNAMCCLGAAFEPRYHPNFITYPRSVSDFFADRAKALLEIELDSPTVATVQAMTVLSAHDVGCKRNARGWLYSGMAMRLAFDLGLHIDMAPHVTERLINEAEAELRRTVFWGTFTVDHLWGFSLGRPVRINMEDVTVDKPGRNQTNDSDRKWAPYGLPCPPPSSLAASVPDPVDILSQHRIQLCEIMTPLGHVLYGCSRVSKRALQGLNENTTGRLLKWKANLPQSLQVDLENPDTPALPHILLLHMQYHQAIIHAHRPWISKRYIQPQPPQGPGHVHARTMCIESAIAISQLLHLYETQYGFRRMNVQAVSITCSAALMLIFATIASLQPEGDQEISAYLSVCFRALEDFGISWESAKRAQNFLISLQRRWESRIRSYNSAKRAHLRHLTYAL
ncbi:transcription factor domain-containing protein [Aspergillus alliaceus]|uniref:transcription factor domain-containing protein n=1 Tax=Petromyces alliaceus TaxID=209559 RepID=UPI0012A60F64|nr:fungal-specific transcription factor domain-containing protein [Aspergillus alliaceus]KAB8231579.1 fungal-specific transcription factor domain-containing protein [Aspergillus alliaceus]